MRGAENDAMQHDDPTDAFRELADAARAYVTAHELGDRDAMLLRAGGLQRQAGFVAAVIERHARRNAEQARARRSQTEANGAGDAETFATRV